jgi:5-methylcytosine-specific restriction endonuclease McrA
MQVRMKRLYDSDEYRKNRRQILKQANYTCCVCGDTATTADHIIPKSMEGSSNKIWNLRAMCRSCNSSRGNELTKVKRISRINNKWL